MAANHLEVERNETSNIEETSAIYEEIDLIDQGGGVGGEVGVIDIKANIAYASHAIAMNQNKGTVDHRYQTDQYLNTGTAGWLTT